MVFLLRHWLVSYLCFVGEIEGDNGKSVGGGFFAFFLRSGFFFCRIVSLESVCLVMVVRWGVPLRLYF